MLGRLRRVSAPSRQHAVAIFALEPVDRKFSLLRAPLKLNVQFRMLVRHHDFHLDRNECPLKMRVNKSIDLKGLPNSEELRVSLI